MKRLFLLSLLTLLACTRPETAPAQGEDIKVGYGPEDIVLDTGSPTPSLLISCSSRRETFPDFGEIIRYDITDGRLTTLIRTDEPANIRFRPHGIFLDTLAVPERLLVVSHESEQPAFHPILIYRVEGDSLRFEEMIDSPLLVSPNTLVTGPAGEVFVVNDAGKRGSLMEKALKMKRADIVRFEKFGGGGYTGEKVAGKLGMPAGVNRIADTLYVSDATLNRVFAYTISKKGLNDRREVVGVTGPDNIRTWHNRLLIACHVKPLAFVRHARSAARPSPCEIISLDPQTGEYEVVFSDDGTRISTPLRGNFLSARFSRT